MDASATGDVSPYVAALGDVRTILFLVLGAFMTLVAWIWRKEREDDKRRLDRHDDRLNNHAQRLTAVDGKIEKEED